MFSWYNASAQCYIYLSDVTEPDLHASFARGPCFTRGWTLQELLAPGNVVLYDQLWRRPGTKV
jgi:hypothetical protein